MIGRPLTLIYRQYENLFCLKLPKIDFLEVKEDQKSPVRDSTCEQAANKAPNIIRSSRRFEEKYFLIFTQIAVPKACHKGSTLIFFEKVDSEKAKLTKSPESKWTTSLKIILTSVECVGCAIDVNLISDGIFLGG